MGILQKIWNLARELLGSTGRTQSEPKRSEMKQPELAWGAKVSPEFRDKVRALCRDLWGADPRYPSWLMACMAFETGRTFSPSVSNPSSSATGLIQFMAATARELGTSTRALARMSAVEQLDWVERYFRQYGRHRQIASLDDMYMRILWPRAMGRSASYPLWRRGSRSYRVNRGLDVNRDGVVTKHEATAKVRTELHEGLKAWNAA